ncbi:MAG: 4-alpha-glucanotransferase [Prolixibacteraceae bacterium]|nr:4-alpha-glucanotransferase [Prolixibacteraceae bacterium]MBN2649945.1 4-alpha-glucanotransferase [Prolixibacteraceae bacterium]
METIFRINYHTQWGESLWISGAGKRLGNWNTNHAQQMEYSGNGEWETVLDFNKNKTVEYKYFLKRNKTILWEGGENRILQTLTHSKIETRDFWRQHIHPNNTFFTKPFTGVFMKRPTPQRKKKTTVSSNSLLFRIRAPRVPHDKTLGIVGNQKQLGNWKKPIAMDASNYPTWEINIDLNNMNYPIEYKYVIIDPKSKEITEWEEGNERSIFYINTSNEITHIQNDEVFRYSTPNWKAAGIAVPVFSLRTNESFGVGEFNDLKKLVDWCVLTGQKMIQVLPINETVATHSWLDSYPYKSISVLALHPIYLNLESLGILNDEKLSDEFSLAKDVLNSKPYVDYVEVTKFKSRYYKLIFDQKWKKVKRTKAYKTFFEANAEWLKPYAAFCFLRDRYKTSDFKEWGLWSNYSPDKIEKLTNPKAKNHEHIAVHYFIQFNLDKQLREVVNYAHQHGIALKGDIPIGISPNSIEAWTEPELFNLDGQAGAPPDDFAVLGQNWGFPTYNWNEMAKNNFAWWRNRLNTMANYFDAYRIDHILGFFRIWEIPKDAVHGLLGHFKPALPLTTDEIANYGIWFDEERFTKPYIRGHFLHEIFGEYTDEVRQLYLNEPEYNIFTVKKGFQTQRSIFNHFTPELESGQRLSEKNVTIRDGLLLLLDEVLFIRDPHSPHLAYHPRITLQYTYSYNELDTETKNQMNELYIDFFFKRHDKFWKNEALSKLPFIIQAGNMMVCGEDLGMIPESVPYVMNELNILSLEIQRMPKNPDIEFSHPAKAPYLSVCTTSTHDMSTIRGWWEENRDRTQRFYHHILEHNGQAPHFAEPWICKEIIKQHLHSPAMWTIFPIQDLIAMDGSLRWDQTDKERINVPSDERNQWKYRMILTLEELLGADDFNQSLSQMIKHSGRQPEV